MLKIKRTKIYKNAESVYRAFKYNVENLRSTGITPTANLKINS